MGPIKEEDQGGAQSGRRRNRKMDLEGAQSGKRIRGDGLDGGPLTVIWTVGT